MSDEFSDLVRKYWFKLPMKLKRRYWRETQFGKLAPSAELHQAVLEELKAILRREENRS